LSSAGRLEKPGKIKTSNMAESKTTTVSSTRKSSQISKLDHESLNRYITKIEPLDGVDPYSIDRNKLIGLMSLSKKNLPDFSFGDIYQYLINTPSKLFNGQTLKAYKSL
ncbi:unnamed protein product, partial [Owenia fusiformis]